MTAPLTWTQHPVMPVPTREQARTIIAKSGEQALIDYYKEREEKIRLEQMDPLRHGYEADVVKRARELLETYDELFIGGCNREGKTETAAKIAVEELTSAPGKIAGFFHSTETSSKLQQHPRVHRFIPPEWRDLGKQGRVANVSFTLKNGFSDNRFVLPNSSIGIFFNYRQDYDVWEGYEFDLLWLDELVPLPVLETIRYRLGRGKRTKILITFMPKHGFTPVVKDILSGMDILETAPAHLLTQNRVHVPGCPPGHMPYVMAHPVKKKAAIYFHWGSNPYGAHKEVKDKLVDATEETIKQRAYGWADRTESGAFPKYGPAHKITRARYEELAKAGGTRYMSVDPGGAKNWFIKWYLVTPQNWIIIHREWPSHQQFGEWALPHETKIDWKPGPAQKLTAGRSTSAYKKTILEAEGHRYDPSTRTWDATNAEPIHERYMDPRAGGTPVPSADEGSSLISLCEEEQRDADGNLVIPGMIFQPAPASQLEESIQMINDWLDYDPDRPLTAENCPRLYIVDDLIHTDLAYREWTGLGTNKCALKDIIDPDRYFIKTDPLHIEPGAYATRGGGSY